MANSNHESSSSQNSLQANSNSQNSSNSDLNSQISEDFSEEHVIGLESEVKAVIASDTKDSNINIVAVNKNFSERLTQAAAYRPYFFTMSREK